MVRKSLGLTFALPAFVLGTATFARAQSAPVVDALTRPAYATLRDEEDWQFLADRSRESDTFDALKYVRLDASPHDYVSFGAELREFYEHYFNANWNARSGSNGYDLQRYLVDADLHLGRARAFVEIESAIVPGRRGGPGPNDRNDLDATEAFVQLGLGGATGAFAPPVALQAGRFEFNYGAGRILAANDGPGIRNSFDGIRAIVRGGGFRTDLFAVDAVAPRVGMFDDVTDHSHALFGVYAARDTRGPSIFEAYAIGDDRKSVAYERGRAHETRYTIGSRAGRTFGRIDTEFEGAYQFGTFGVSHIAAYALATSLGYTISTRRIVTHLSLGAGIGSGDRDPTSTTFAAFRPPTFKGQYFGAIAANGPINSVGFEPGFATTLDGRLTLVANDLIFARASRADGVYGIAGNLLVPSSPARSESLGGGPLVSLAYRFDGHSSLQTIYQRYFVGPFLASSSNARDNIAYYRTVLDYKF